MLKLLLLGTLIENDGTLSVLWSSKADAPVEVLDIQGFAEGW